MSREICLKSIRFSGKTYAPGKPIEIDDADEVPRLKKLGALVDDGGGDATATSDVGGGDATAATLDQIVDAVGRVGGDDLKQDGTPKIDAVRDLLGDLTVDGKALKEATDYIALQNED